METKSIKDLTRQRNSLQEWLVNSGAWQRHPTLYKRVESAWQHYVTNIERHARKSLVKEGLRSAFALKKYPANVYKGAV